MASHSSCHRRILGIIGPSGAGKTSLVRLLTGALVPGSGRLTVLGEEPRHFRRETRERIGYMPQSFTLYPDLTVRENVDFVASLFGMLFFSRRRRTRQVLELLDLWTVRGRRAGRLSGGMQRRLELAGASSTIRPCCSSTSRQRGSIPCSGRGSGTSSIAFALPVTHGIQLIQDTMLRGSTTELWEFAALGVIAAVTLVAAWSGLRRGMARA